MAIDPSIILQGRPPQIEDPASVRIKQATLADLLTQQQGRQLQLQEAQRGIQEQQTIADLYRSVGNDPTKLIGGMAERGLGARIPEFQKQQAALGKSMTENEAAKYKLLKEQIDDGNAGMAALLSDPQLTHDKVLSFLSSRVRLGVLPAEQGAEIARSLPGDIPRLRQTLMEKALQGLEASKRIDLILGKTEMQDQGGARQVFKTNQLTGEVIPGPSFAKTATPEAILADQRARSEGALNRGVQIRGQDLTYKSTQEAREKKPDTAATKVNEANEALALIDQAGPLLEGSTGSYVGAGIDRLAQAFGAATPGSIKAQQLKALEGALIAKMPKMSGPQSDKDVALYKQMAGAIGDDTIPYARKVAALQTVREIQERYAGGKGVAPSAPVQGAEEDGYIFLGGNPADPKRWKKK